MTDADQPNPTSGIDDRQPDEWGSLAICAGGAVIGLLAELWRIPHGYAVSLLSTAVMLLVIFAPARFRPRPLAVWLVLALSASGIVTLQVNASTPPDSYWPAFFIWLAAVVSVIPVVYGSDLFGWLQNPRPWLRTHGGEAAIVAGLTLAAFLVRVINLSSIPSPFSGDEANMFLQALSVTRGELENMFRSGLLGHPTAYFFTLSGLTAVFGESVSAVRLFGVFYGTLAVPAVYLLLRYLFDRWIAFLGAAYLVTYHFALHYSRIDLNNIGDVPILALTSLILWRAVTHRRLADFALLGWICGLGFYVNVGSRVGVLLAIAVWTTTLALQYRNWRPHILGAAFCVGAFLIVSGPLSMFWYEHPDEFSTRLNQTGIFQTGWLDEEVERTGDSRVEVLWGKTKEAFGGFGYFDDDSPHYKSPISLLEMPAFPFFLLGIAISLRRVFEPRYMILLMLFVGVVASGSILTEPPTYQRVVGAVAAVAAFVALGLAGASTALSQMLHARVSRAIVGSLLAALLVYNLVYYFGEYANGDYYSDRNTRITEHAGDYINSLPRDTQIYWYGSPAIFAGHPSLALKTRDWTIHNVFEDGRVEPEPHGQFTSTVSLFLVNHRADELESLMARCPGGELLVHGTEEDATMFKSYTPPPSTPCPPEGYVERRVETP